VSDEMRGCKPPSETQPKLWRVIYPLAGVVLDLTFLGSYAWGMSLHWRPSGQWGTARHVACLGDGCEGCGKWREDWRGYYPVWCHKNHAPRVLVVTELRYRGLKSKLFPETKLIGTRWEVIGKGNNSASAVSMWQRSLNKPICPRPPEFCLLATLRKIYPEAAHILVPGLEWEAES
jgi:hypothetical protein